ncbi:MAG: protein kinase [Polyangiaceae bacterium]
MEGSSNAPGSDRLPATLAEFEIVRRLGAGGMAEVFLAKKPGAEGTYKLLVVKRILPSFGASRRFRTMFVEEAQVATRLNHPNVVQVYEFYDEGDEIGHLLAMEWVEGPDLGRLMSATKTTGSRIPMGVAAWITSEVAKGLHYAHEKKDEGGVPLHIVHRDVSPQNILLSFEGAVKIADFGIASARIAEDDEGMLKGKFGYMAPEQARVERVDRRSDVYSLGVILWEMLTGRPLHGGLGGEALLDIVRSGTVEPPSTYVTDLPRELEDIVLRALAPNRDDRFPTCKDLSSALLRFLMARQELVDAGSLETTIAMFVPREHFAVVAPSTPPPDAPLRGGTAATYAAAPQARSEAEGPDARRGSEPPSSYVPPSVQSDAQAPTPVPRRLAIPEGGPREVRHVAVLTLKLHGLENREHHGEAVLARALERLRAMLGEIAYKRGMTWMWHSDSEARAVAGLATNPTRAASDAAWVALDTHEAIAGILEDLPFDVGAAIGIVRGIASGNRDAHGHLVRYQLQHPATLLADVLGRETPVHLTWVAGGVYRLIRREFRWGDAPTLRIDGGTENHEGFADSVPPTMRIYALERSLSRDERLAETANAPNDLVGRDAEKADLLSAFHEAVSGNNGGGTLTCRAVIGEMGIGKSALVSALVSELPPNARLFKVETSPVRAEVPYSVIAELVRDAIGTTGDEPFEAVCDLIAKAGGGAAQGDASNPMVARLAELATNRLVVPAEEEDVHYRKKLIATGVRNILAAIAIQQPVVLVFEGLQWADRPSLDLVADVLKSGLPLPILVLLVTRPEERVLPVLEGVVRVELRGLSADEQVRLVEARLDVREGIRRVVAELMPKVGGNPFFLLEMVDALLERGALEIREVESPSGETEHVVVRSDRAETGFQALPQTLEQLLGDRIRELPLEEHAVVDWLAIAGGPLALSDLLRLMKTEDDEAVVRLCARGFCDRRGELIDFRSPLMRDVAYLALDPIHRIDMHRDLGEHLAKTSLGRGLSAAIVARHFARGEVIERAAEFYYEAATAARAGHQTQLALRYFHRALSMFEAKDPRRFEAHEALEGIYRMSGRRRDRMRHLDALRASAKHVATPRSVCVALLRTARFHEDEGHLTRGLSIARRAAETAHKAGMPLLEIEGEALVSDFLRELGDVQGALAACDRALTASDAKVNPGIPPRARADVLRSRGILLRRVGRVRESVDAYVDAIAMFKKVGAVRQEARCKDVLAYALFVEGRYEDAISLALEAIRLTLSIGGRTQLANTISNIGHSYARLGDMPRAVAYFQRARDAHERYGDQDKYADTLIVSAEVLLEVGELARAESFLGDAAALNAVTNNAYDFTHLAIVRAALARIRGDSHAAIVHAVEARRAAENHALVSFHFYGLALEAISRAELGETHTASVLATTALGSVATLQGCEYGLEIRTLAAKALEIAESPRAAEAKKQATDHAVALLAAIHEPRHRALFVKRPLVKPLFTSLVAESKRASGDVGAEEGSAPS